MIVQSKVRYFTNRCLNECGEHLQYKVIFSGAKLEMNFRQQSRDAVFYFFLKSRAFSYRTIQRPWRWLLSPGWSGYKVPGLNGPHSCLCHPKKKLWLCSFAFFIPCCVRFRLMSALASMLPLRYPPAHPLQFTPSKSVNETASSGACLG